MTLPENEPVRIRIDAREVARYDPGTAMAAARSPRPYLHPVRTPAGRVLTEVEPADHRHHYGVSAAVVDIDGTTYWGGKSFVADSGYVMLPNQGRQVGAAPTVTDSDPGRAEVSQRLTWFGADGAEQLAERRTLRFQRRSSAAADALLLTWRSDLRPLQGDVTVGSPATRGRVGAGYGGLFWRVGPQAPTQVRAGGLDGWVEGEEAALGHRSPWLTLTQVRDGSPITLLLGQPGDDLLPWFVRTSGYVGAGPAIAWAEPVSWQHGSEHSLQLWAATLDAEIEPETACTIHADLEHLAS